MASSRSFSTLSNSSFSLSPYLGDRLTSTISEAQAKVMSKMDQLHKKSGGLAKLKSSVFSVVNDIKSLRSFEQLGYPLRASSGSLNTSDTASVAAGDRKYANEDVASVKVDECSLCMKQVGDDEIQVVHDPAFQLSSGETGTLLNYDSNGMWARETTCDATDGVEVLMCSSSKCSQCGLLLYDEEIMSGWSPDDSELKSRCNFCGNSFVPNLKVVIREFSETLPESWYYRRAPSAFDSPVASDSSLSGKLDGEGNARLLKVGSGVATTSGHKSLCKSDSSLNVADCSSRGFIHHNSVRFEPNGQAANATAVSSKSHDSRGAKPDLWRNDSDKRVDVSNIVSITVPYLSPIVLRKELENIIISEGDGVLTNESFLERHPIVYWNMVYVFQRICVPSHLLTWIPNFYLKDLRARGIAADQLPDLSKSKRRVPLVRCVYELPICREDSSDMTPLFLTPSVPPQRECNSSSLVQALFIENRVVYKTLRQQILDYLSAQNLHKPIQLLLNEHRKVSTPWDDFDHEYRVAFGKLPPKIAAMLPAYDRPPSFAVTACRKVFMPLDVC
ncbi:unnamed protein product [Soboliphyme baturini]|uniref:SNF2 domain-containing protein CLASSY 1-like n=1 Tax=Soboliphyme baturini TaxID=241478 RepID=A0A183J8F7_9BILA|nr:unnamed protein product [Soboliphyme baturini]